MYLLISILQYRHGQSVQRPNLQGGIHQLLHSVGLYNFRISIVLIKLLVIFRGSEKHQSPLLSQVSFWEVILAGVVHRGCLPWESVVSGLPLKFLGATNGCGGRSHATLERKRGGTSWQVAHGNSMSMRLLFIDEW